MTRQEVVTLIECRGCDYKGTKTQENQEQGFLNKEQLSMKGIKRCGIEEIEKQKAEGPKE